MNAAAGDYHLAQNSPAINKGDNAAPAFPATDRDGKPRIFAGVADLGAFEYSTADSCTLDLTLSYNAPTLNLGFLLGTLSPARWSAWLASKNGVSPLWAFDLPAIQPPLSFNVPISNFPALGNVGVLTTLTTTAKGLVCWDLDTVNTGGTGLSAEQVRQLLLLQVPPGR
ncbi:MAG: choice-of-anchor Q domain-containing protein [Bryobacteraceae bacterium]